MAVKRTAAKKVSRKAAERPQEPAEGPLCMVEGCDKRVLHRGLCETHWEDPAA